MITPTVQSSQFHKKRIFLTWLPFLSLSSFAFKVGLVWLISCNTFIKRGPSSQATMCPLTTLIKFHKIHSSNSIYHFFSIKKPINILKSPRKKITQFLWSKVCGFFSTVREVSLAVIALSNSSFDDDPFLYLSFFCSFRG